MSDNGYRELSNTFRDYYFLTNKNIIISKYKTTHTYRAVKTTSCNTNQIRNENQSEKSDQKNSITYALFIDFDS